MSSNMNGLVLSSLFIAAQSWAGTLYLVNDNSGFFSVDTTTAATTLISNDPSYRLEGLSLSGSASQLYAVNNDSTLYKLNIDGSGVTAGPTIDSDYDRGLTYNTATGMLYGSDNSGFGRIDPLTGTGTPLSAIGNDIEGLAADPTTNTVYGLDNSQNLYAYNVALDNWTLVGSTGLGDGNDNGLAFDSEHNVLYAVENNGDLWSINPATAASTLIGNTGLSSDFGLAYLPSPTQEVPLSQGAKLLLALLLAGGASFMMRRRRVA